MLTIEFGPLDLASVRFGVSPLIELWQSVRALQNPAAEALHPTWLGDARARVRDLDLRMLYALQPPQGSSPDFIHPPPEGPCGELEAELAHMLATPADQIRAEILSAHGHGGVPSAIERFVEAPEAAIVELADLVRCYWQRVLEPHWERIRTRLEGDVLWRAQQVAGGGLKALFADLDHSIRYKDARLVIDKSWRGSLDLHGRGLLLVPSVFVWPAVAIVEQAPWQPTLIYPARGCGLVWEPVEPAPEGLAALLGARRATILASLERPCSTTDLACRLEVVPSSISQHLTVLHEAGLIERHRVGRVVLYRRTAAGNVLLGAGDGKVSGLEAA
ncbi:MAG: winged helix-turn-helix transcriptional regulator [Solirubrobacterales bacterium]|nr:winged helix-turn-helix transcriptional regulator [Solirubrobacterales bacterium]